MFSKINHVAIVSENYAKSALFYQAVFGMRTSDKTQVSRAQTVGDGYVGLNINPRRAGRRPASIISASRSRMPKPRSSACAANTRP
jgi:catechol 2,3-dioxygenase-like lactoylglutathione lyase family enzyme